jgi:hypothetical protein
MYLKFFQLQEVQFVCIKLKTHKRLLIIQEYCKISILVGNTITLYSIRCAIKPYENFINRLSVCLYLCILYIISKVLKCYFSSYQVNFLKTFNFFLVDAAIQYEVGY